MAESQVRPNAIDKQYKGLIRKILTKGDEELNARTQTVTRALSGEQIRIQPEDGFPLLTLRALSLNVVAAEAPWFISGSRRPEELLNRFAKIWDNFENYDGVVTTAYGYRWRHHFGRDQLAELVQTLENDKSSRQGVVLAWDPGSDGLRGVSKKNVPCPFGFTVNIIGNRLNLINHMRSQDCIPGLPFDVTTFALIQRLLAARLGVEVGTYTHNIDHAHIYKPHYSIARELLRRKPTTEPIPIHFDLKPSYWDTAMRGLDDIDAVVEVANEIRGLIAPQYRPLPAIKGIPIMG